MTCLLVAVCAASRCLNGREESNLARNPCCPLSLRRVVGWHGADPPHEAESTKRIGGGPPRVQGPGGDVSVWRGACGGVDVPTTRCGSRNAARLPIGRNSGTCWARGLRRNRYRYHR